MDIQKFTKYIKKVQLNKNNIQFFVIPQKFTPNKISIQKTIFHKNMLPTLFQLCDVQ